MKWIYHKVRLNYFIIECVDTWLLRGISEQNVDDWGLAKGQQTPSMNASEQSCSNIKCDAIFMLQFLEIKSTAWLRSVSFIHIRFEKIKTCICWFFVQRSKASETRCAAWMGILFMKLLSWLSCIMVRSLTLVLTKWWRHLEIDHQAKVVRGVPGSGEY